MDLDFFFELDDRLYQHEASVPSSSSLELDLITEAEKKEISKMTFDYDLFRYDFSLTCKFMDILCRLEKKRYSEFHLLMLKHIFILSTFLKNRTTTKLFSKNENFLLKVNEHLTFVLSLKSIVVPYKIYDTCRSYAAFSLVNIHELAGITKNVPTNRLASEFFTFEIKSAEKFLISRTSDFKDYLEVAKALDDTVESSAFMKYNKVREIKPDFKKQIEKHLICVFIAYTAIISIVVLTFAELGLARVHL